MAKHEIRCKECGRESLVSYEEAKAVETGVRFCSRPVYVSDDLPNYPCLGTLVRVWGSTGHIWVGKNGVDLSNPLAG